MLRLTNSDNITRLNISSEFDCCLDIYCIPKEYLNMCKIV